MKGSFLSVRARAFTGFSAFAMAVAAMAPPPAMAKGQPLMLGAMDATVVAWLNPEPKQPSASERARLRSYARSLDSRHGRGSHICSASGFGQRSSCFAR